VTTGDLDERGAGTGGWRGESGRQDELAGPEAGLEGAGEEVRRGDRPPTGGGHHLHPSPQQDQERRELGGGIRVDQASHDGAAAADRGMADRAEHLGEQRQAVLHRRVVLHPGLRGERRDPDRRRCHGHLVQGLDPPDVDDVGRCRQAHREQWQQALATRQDRRVRAERRQEGQGLLERLRRVVGERGGLHHRPRPLMASPGCPPRYEARPSTPPRTEALSHSAGVGSPTAGSPGGMRPPRTGPGPGRRERPAPALQAHWGPTTSPGWPSPTPPPSRAGCGSQ
jgi:hypothetical protein